MVSVHSIIKIYFIGLMCFSGTVSAVEILAVVSPRNTADVLGGAHQFLQENLTHRINLRTTDQFIGLTEDERQKLLGSADVVFVGGVFGDSAKLFKGYVSGNDRLPIKSFVAVHSDRILVNASHLKQVPMLRGADVDELMNDPPAEPGLDVTQWSVNRLDEFSSYRPWLLSKTFWSDRDTANMNGLFRHLTSLAGVEIGVPMPILLKPQECLLMVGK